MDIGMPEIIIVLVIVLLLFGPGRIGKVAGELGKGIRNFREGVTGENEKPAEEKKAEKSEEESK